MTGQVADAARDDGLVACSMLSGNRGFVRQVNPLVKANYLASLLLVVAYAVVGTVRVNLYKNPLGEDHDGDPVHLKDKWPGHKEVSTIAEKTVPRGMVTSKYVDVYGGDKAWRCIKVGGGLAYEWPVGSTCVRYSALLGGDVAEAWRSRELGGRPSVGDDERLHHWSRDAHQGEHGGEAGVDASAGVAG